MRPSLVLVALTTVIAALAAGCSSSEYEPTVEDKDAYLNALVRAMGYEGDDALSKINATLYDQGVAGALDTCDSIRGDRETAVRGFGIARAMYEDNDMLISAEDEWRLAIRYLCPDAADAFTEILEEAW